MNRNMEELNMLEEQIIKHINTEDYSHIKTYLEKVRDRIDELEEIEFKYIDLTY